MFGKQAANSSAALKYTGFILVLEALYTHTECIWFIATILLYHPAKLRKKNKGRNLLFPEKENEIAALIK